MNGFAILDTIIFRNAIELAAITILCHSHLLHVPWRGFLIGCMFQAAVIYFSHGPQNLSVSLFPVKVANKYLAYVQPLVSNNR